MNRHRGPARGVLAYDAATGRILHVHFTALGRPEGGPDPAEAELHDHLGERTAGVRLLHVGAGALQPGTRYRVDPEAGALVAALADEPGFGAAAGVKGPQPQPIQGRRSQLGDARSGRS